LRGERGSLLAISSGERHGRSREREADRHVLRDAMRDASVAHDEDDLSLLFDAARERLRLVEVRDDRASLAIEARGLVGVAALLERKTREEGTDAERRVP